MSGAPKTIGRVNEATTVSKIKPGHVELLRLALNNSTDIAHAALANVESIHYISWMILPMNGAHYLIFVTNYTGTFDKYIDDFASVLQLHLGLDAIWSNCEGWTGTEDVQALKDLILRTATGADLYYAAYPDVTVRDVMRTQRAAKVVEEFLELS